MLRRFYRGIGIMGLGNEYLFNLKRTSGHSFCKIINQPFCRSLFSGRRGVFRAACIFAKARKAETDSQSRVCSKISDSISSHIAPVYGTVSCKVCHRTRCLRHLLSTNKMHAVNIMLQRVYDPQDHHQHHTDARRNHDSGLVAFKKSEETGSPFNSIIQWTDLAINFGTCKPLNPEYLALGWYDRTFVSIQASVTSMASVGDVLDERPSWPPPSTRAESSILTTSSQVASRSSSAYPKQSIPRKTVFDCVLLPTAESLGLTKTGSSESPDRGLSSDETLEFNPEDRRPLSGQLLPTGQGGRPRVHDISSEKPGQTHPLPSSSKSNKTEKKPNTALRKPITSWQPSNITSNQKSSTLAGLKFQKVQTSPISAKSASEMGQLSPRQPNIPLFTSHSNQHVSDDILEGLNIINCPRQELQDLAQKLKRRLDEESEENEILRQQLNAKDEESRTLRQQLIERNEKIDIFERRLELTEMPSAQIAVVQTVENGRNLRSGMNNFGPAHRPRQLQYSSRLSSVVSSGPHPQFYEKYEYRNVPSGPRGRPNRSTERIAHERSHHGSSVPNRRFLAQEDDIQNAGSDMDISDTEKDLV
ncbi:hypothetical protein K435DRAFT_347934 [Dendrothele bispora CBS 962.96]|uniref:Uncharacterized protein n=1 Tax=Dendrothele bispora (strain CBS 962.96) TaxID=1314807 RepID=A0A4S8LE48_DENBC|nr:hypothetical protein K435DRAFT_347934 [Dendrothele bispora CBS 962.96]